MNSVTLLGVRIDDVPAEEALRLFSSWLQGVIPRVVVTPNPEFLLLARHDAEFRGMLNGADLALPDGVGLRFATSALTNETLAHRTTGVDTLQHLAALCNKERKCMLLLGGAPGVADAATRALRAQHVDLDVVAVDPGNVDDDGNLAPHVIAHVADARPTVLVVALGQGKQERVMVRYATTWPSVRIAIGVGGALDTVSGRKPRAPKALRNAGLEWLWRLLVEPRRFVRIFRAFVVFPAAVVWATLRERRFLTACRRTVPEILDQLFGGKQ